LKGDLGILSVNGPVAFSARMVDGSDIRGHKLEPWLIELKLDGEVVYRCRNDRFAFSENSLQRLEWTNWADWTEDGVPREHWLHRRPANTLPGREGELWYLGADGSGLETGDHHFVLTVVDFAGGSASVHWVVQVEKGIAVPSEPDYWFPEPLGIGNKNIPKLEASAAASLRLTPFYSAGDPGALGLDVIKLDPTSGDPVLESIEIWLNRQYPNLKMTEISSNQGLTFAGWGKFIYAADWPIESSVPLPLAFKGFPSPNSKSITDFSKGAGVYRWKNNKKWDYVGPCSLESQSFHFEEPGWHVVFIDVAAPEFQSTQEVIAIIPGPVSTLTEISLPRWGITAIALDDPGSGVDTGTLTAQLDGQPLIVEPDPPRDRILIEWPDELTAGSHELRLSVSDAAGNLAEAFYLLNVLDK